MAVADKLVHGKYDGGHGIELAEPLELPAGTEVDVLVRVANQTWASVRLGIPPIRLRGEGPSASGIVIEERQTGP